LVKIPQAGESAQAHPEVFHFGKSVRNRWAAPSACACALRTASNACSRALRIADEGGAGGVTGWGPAVLIGSQTSATVTTSTSSSALNPAYDRSCKTVSA
jgi:hypothetical protein